MIIVNRINIVDCHNCGDRFFPGSVKAPCPSCGACPSEFPEAD